MFLSNTLRSAKYQYLILTDSNMYSRETLKQASLMVIKKYEVQYDMTLYQNIEYSDFRQK